MDKVNKRQRRKKRGVKQRQREFKAKGERKGEEDGLEGLHKEGSSELRGERAEGKVRKG